MVSKEEIREWFNSNGYFAQGRTPTHVIVVCDTFEWSDYPVWVYEGEDPHKVAKKYDGVDMQKIMLVLSKNTKYNLEEQLNKHSHNYD